MTFRRSLIAGLIFLSMFFRLSAQEKGSQVDSLVRLLSAQSMELIEKDGVDYRKVTGPARFLHNDTFLICDTALWNVRTNEIFAISNVKILQDQTVLTGDKLTYYVTVTWPSSAVRWCSWRTRTTMCSVRNSLTIIRVTVSRYFSTAVP